jgi:hypothetical protein
VKPKGMGPVKRCEHNLDDKVKLDFELMSKYSVFIGFMIWFIERMNFHVLV